MERIKNAAIKKMELKSLFCSQSISILAICTKKKKLSALL